MSYDLIPATALLDFNDEPRIRDLELAAYLEMAQPLNIRTVIAANRMELEMHGGFHVARENPGKRGGRPGKAYYLNEGQALVICALSRTDRAAEIRKAIIDVFMAYRHGKLVDVKAHYRRPPEPAVHNAPEQAKPALPASDFRLTRRWDGMCEMYILAPLEKAIAVTKAYAGA